MTQAKERADGRAWWPGEDGRTPAEVRLMALSPAEVGALLRSLGFSCTPEDLEEVTHRLDAFAHALEPLGALSLAPASPPGAALDLLLS